VATQDPRLREKFAGKPEHAVNFMRFIAQHLREIMAQLGFRKLEDMVGRVDMLEPRAAIDHWKAKGFDFSNILYAPDAGPEIGRFRQIGQDHGIDKSLDVSTLLGLCEPAIARGEKVSAELPVRNVNRVVGTITGSEISRKYGGKGLPDPATYSIASQLGTQLFACVVTIVYTGGATFGLLKVIDASIGLRVDGDSETRGLDQSLHEETGYNY